MTCYFRHIAKTFEKAGILITSENKREIDRIIHNIVCVKYKNCSETWKKVKGIISEDEAGFISNMREKWNPK